jgi:hypothetical protein
VRSTGIVDSRTALNSADLFPRDLHSSGLRQRLSIRSGTELEEFIS